MSGFIASPPEPASPAGAKVTGGPFWPDVDLNQFRDAMRVGGSEIPDARLIPAIEGAIISVDKDLTDWRTMREADGYTALGDIPSPLINGVKRNIVLWLRAVRSYATADLIETHRDLSTTNEGARRAEEQQPTACDHRRMAVQAVRDIKGKRRIIAELV